MQFEINQPAFILGQYLPASVQEPKIITLPNDVSDDHVSPLWKPIDQDAATYVEEMLKKQADANAAARQAVEVLDARTAGRKPSDMKAEPVAPIRVGEPTDGATHIPVDSNGAPKVAPRKRSGHGADTLSGMQSHK